MSSDEVRERCPTCGSNDRNKYAWSFGCVNPETRNPWHSEAGSQAGHSPQPCKTCAIYEEGGIRCKECGRRIGPIGSPSPQPHPGPDWKSLFTELHELWGRYKVGEEYCQAVKDQFGRLLHHAQELETSQGELEEALRQRWMPVEENSPKSGKGELLLLATTNQLIDPILGYRKISGDFQSQHHKDIPWVITYWMPSPKPPKAESLLADQPKKGGERR